MIQSSDLHKVWAAPDNSRLTSKQYSFRLPVHVAAKLAALCELYPNRTRTELVGDLLAGALGDLEQGLPCVKGKQWGKDPATGEMLYEDVGIGSRYRALVNRHYLGIEKELGNPKPTPLYSSAALVTEADLEAK